MSDDIYEAREAAEMEWVANYEEKQEFKQKVLIRVQTIQENLIRARNEINRQVTIINHIDDDLVALRSMIEDE